MKTVELYLIRHGKTPGNEEKRYVGRTEESLSEKGRRELLEKQAPTVEALFASPMRRCRESCQCLYPGVKPIVIEAFREIDFGTFEGKNYLDLSGDKDYQAWIDSGGTMAFPQGESRQDFIKRNLAGFQELLTTLREIPEEKISAAAVVHGGTIMSILSGAYGGDYYDYQIPNGEGYRVCMKLEENDFQILSAERI